MARRGAIRGNVTKSVPGVPKKYFRPDIEGLRAIAVVLVILDHLVRWPTGGFIGVDVFFVISGFLITGLLIREHNRTGSISFTKFYLRRVRRIAPAATLVILVTAIVGFLVLSVARAQQVVVDGIWSFLFAANWRFAAAGTDYFDAGAAVSPLQHFWSLSVEEQFYLVWPWLTLAILTLFVTKQRVPKATKDASARRALIIVFSVVVVISFAWACISSLQNPSLAYFDTTTRTWELGLGALLAALTSTVAKIPERIRPILAWIGIVGILASAALITQQMPFPGPTAALPVLSTALVIAAGVGGTQRGLAPLTNVVMRYIGRISYSLYLWHFPVVIYLGVLMGESNPFYIPLSLVVMVVLAALSFHFVEDPIRRSHWLESKKDKRHDHTRPQGEISSGNKVAIGALAIVAAGVIAVVAVAGMRVAPAPTTGIAIGASVAPTAAPVVDTVLEDRKAQIQEALRADSWPALSPSVDTFGTNGRDVIATEWLNDGCLGDDDAVERDPIENTTHCAYGNAAADAAHTAVVFGDSVAISYLPAVRQALGPDWQVKSYTLAACPASSADVKRVNGNEFPECAEFRAWAIEQITTLNPALVFLSEASDDIRLVSGATGEAASAEWRAAATTTMTALSGIGGRVIVLSRPPVGVTLFDCQTPVSGPKDCISTIQDGFTNRSKMLSEVATQVGGAIRYYDTSNWFCNLGQCPSFISGIPVFADGFHLTNAESIAIAPIVAYTIGQATAS